MLLVLRKYEEQAAVVEARRVFDPQLRRYINPFAVRVRIGLDPVLSFGRPRARFFNPFFLVGTLAIYEPFSVLAPAGVWWALYIDEYRAAGLIGLGWIVWRLVVDGFIMFRQIAMVDRLPTLFLKMVWSLATGIWLASLAYALVVVFLVMVAACALMAAHRDPRKRR